MRKNWAGEQAGAPHGGAASLRASQGRGSRASSGMPSATCAPTAGPGRAASDRRLFTDRTEGLSREEARALLMEHAGRRVAYHRLILSPGMPVEDVQRWTRLVMADLSRHLGQELHWVAAAHRNTAHPHVHLLLAGTGERAGGGAGDVPVLLRPRNMRCCASRATGTRGNGAGRARSREQCEPSGLDARGPGTRPGPGAGRRRCPDAQTSGRTARAAGAPGRDATRGR